VKIARVALLFVTIASEATAGPLGDAIAHGDLATLRAQLADPAARCALGTVYAKRGDLSRAALYLERCDDAKLPDDVEPAVTHAMTDTSRKLGDSDLAVLDVVTHPEGFVAEIDALPGERFATPATLYIKAGSYEVRAAADADALDGKRGIAKRVATEARKRSAVVLEGPRRAPPARAGRADFDDGELGESHDGPPPEAQHDPLMPKKYRRGVATADPEPKPEGWIDDPMEAKVAVTTELPARRTSLRGGAGAFTHGGGGRAGIDLGVEHHAIAWGDAYPVELVARVDYSQRGSESDAIHTLGAAAGVDKVVARPGEHRLAVGLGLRGDLRLADTLDMTPIHRFGLDATAGAELALAQAPIVIGARYELGLTPIAPGTREQAFVVEVGFELRRY
jgi:hypothetical protein